MRCIPILTLVFVLVGNVANQERNMRTSFPSTHPITRAIEIVEFVSRISEPRDNFTATQMSSPASDLENTLTVVDLLWEVLAKALSALASALMYAVSLIFDPATPTASTVISTSGLPYEYYTISYRDFDYQQLIASLTRLPDQAFTMLDIKEEQCRKRAVCEMGAQATTYFPVLSDWIRLVAARIEMPPHHYAKDAARGLGWNDCHVVYQDQCPVSPFKKFYRLYSALSKLY